MQAGMKGQAEPREHDSKLFMLWDHAYWMSLRPASMIALTVPGGDPVYNQCARFQRAL